MSKGIIITAIILIVIGVVLFTVVMTANGWDFGKLGTSRYETNTHSVSDSFTNVSVVTDTADIILAHSDDGECKVVCYEEETAKHFVEVADGTLTVKVINEKKWYDYIGINFGSPKITVYLPQGEYGALSVKGSTGKAEIPDGFRFESADISLSTGNVTSAADVTGDMQIKTSTGDIRVENTSAGAMDLSVSTGMITVDGVKCDGDISTKVSTGKATLADVACGSLNSAGSTGNITMENVIARERLSVERSTGDVKFDGCDAEEIFVKTDTGNVKGTLLSEKVFITKTDTGKVSVPKSVTGGKCEISTDTGDIKIDCIAVAE